MQETERNRSNEPSVPAVLFDPAVRVDEAGNGVLAALVLESGAAGRLRAGLPLLQLVLEVGQALRAVRRAGSDESQSVPWRAPQTRGSGLTPARY